MPNAALCRLHYFILEKAKNFVNPLCEIPLRPLWFQAWVFKAIFPNEKLLNHFRNRLKQIQQLKNPSEIFNFDISATSTLTRTL